MNNNKFKLRPAFTQAQSWPPRRRKHQKRDINVAQNGQLHGLFKNASPSFCVGYRSPTSMLQFLDL